MDTKDQIITELRQKIAMLREENQSLKEEIAKLEKNPATPPSRLRVTLLSR